MLNVFIVLGSLTLSALALTCEASAMTRAGTLIQTSATVRFETGGATRTVQSNTVETRVAELVNFEVSVVRPMLGATAGETLTYMVDITNTGNGAECFAVGQDQGVKDQGVSAAKTLNLIALHADSDGDGAFNATKDAWVTTSACGPQIAPGRSLRVFALGRMPDDATMEPAELALRATHAEGGAGYGAVIPGRGDGGGDMVIGFDHAPRAARMWARASTLIVSLVKSQLVSGRAPTIAQATGGATRTATAVAGDVITYSLRLKAGGQGVVKSAVVSDPLPADLLYLPGTLALDGVALSDGHDADAGQSADGVVAVRLPDQAAPFERTITFQAVVRPQSS